MGVWELTFVAFGELFFWVFDPFIFGGHNFFNSISHLMIFSVLDVSIRGVQILFGHQKQWSLPFDLACPEHLVISRFTLILVWTIYVCKCEVFPFQFAIELKQCSLLNIHETYSHWEKIFSPIASMNYKLKPTTFQPWIFF